MPPITLQMVKDVAQIINYLAVTITGPLAVLTYLRAKRREQADREYRIYDELDNKFLEYQKLALAHDLELIDLPDYDPRIGTNGPRKKQELVAYGIAFSLFQRAYLMFHGQSDQFKKRQWLGWEDYLMHFLERNTVRDAWQVCKGHYDAKFQDYVNGKLIESMRASGTEPAVLHAFQQTGIFIRDETWHLFTEDQKKNWEQALQQYRGPRKAA